MGGREGDRERERETVSERQRKREIFGTQSNN